MNTADCEWVSCRVIIPVPMKTVYRDKQHLVHLLSVGALYMAVDEVKAALAPAPGVQRAILDLGLFV